MRKWLVQVFGAVLVGVLTWWLTEGLRRQPTPPPVNPPYHTSPGAEDRLRQALQDYEAVQAHYESTKKSKECVTAHRAIEHMNLYAGNMRTVPESFQSSITHPAPKPSPTISDLVVDRTSRIKETHRECF